jgi:hypothetical protein
MSVTQVYKAWIILLVLSVATTSLTLVGGQSGLVTAGLLLVIAGLKARTILGQYLELSHSAFWTKLFNLVIGLFLIIAFVLYATGTGASS